jgi:hypothetical protein
LICLVQLVLTWTPQLLLLKPNLIPTPNIKFNILLLIFCSSAVCQHQIITLTF